MSLKQEEVFEFNLYIGSYGSQSDGGIMNASLFGKDLLNCTLDLPDDSPLPGSNVPVPFYLVGDEAFPLRPNLMRPYSKQRNGPMDQTELIFNYRLSRCRRIIENTFGILVSRFRIFHRVIH
ncbi:uncharacterized protein LOC116176561 [Photinus pyralis]|uniref:uncharacterized protein LOC116176561 n=1 Tax=Photinus pyralis TaxID=7054 RepID=UPI0012677CBC|nr:uncharacterized protein LOC116176561 [Photinus pyralis]